MGLIDFILNVAGLLLWLNWRSLRFDPLQRTSASSLAATLRRAGPTRLRRWHYLAALLGLILARPLLYKHLGAAVGWTPKLQLGAIALSFRSDFLSRMLLYSLISFVAAWSVFYLWLLLLSIVNRHQEDPIQRIVRWQLGGVDRLHLALKLVLPWLLVFVTWLLIQPLLVRWAVVPATSSWAHVVQQAALIGLGVYLAWKYIIGAVLVSYLVSSYIYLGKHPLVEFIAMTGRNMLKPLAILPFLRIGRVDFSPVVALALVFFLAELLERSLTALYLKLPF
jgi:uncharacterized protein YggT (Ycf19 family)